MWSCKMPWSKALYSAAAMKPSGWPVYSFASRRFRNNGTGHRTAWTRSAPIRWWTAAGCATCFSRFPRTRNTICNWKCHRFSRSIRLTRSRWPVRPRPTSRRTEGSAISSRGRAGVSGSAGAVRPCRSEILLVSYTKCTCTCHRTTEIPRSRPSWLR